MPNNIHLIVIDPQVDFCDPSGSLYVKGADQDMQRLATMVRRLKDKIRDIHVTLDSHQIVHIAHPIFWKDGATGAHPNPFTIIKVRRGSVGKMDSHSARAAEACRGLRFAIGEKRALPALHLAAALLDRQRGAKRISAFL